ncbi:unnamed protein product [Notodromas monacha]|uniref:C2H2-type domain-containing protein n=1 Tax=Notodromas monacha TaxID=399045 RepID=A0A7R9GB97_9CRUS|nr:unnamed protein product [Notodromas monacha]CAG0916275.1 unnamed protein product [Notodromas monacha]
MTAYSSAVRWSLRLFRGGLLFGSPRHLQKAGTCVSSGGGCRSGSGTPPPPPPPAHSTPSTDASLEKLQTLCVQLSGNHHISQHQHRQNQQDNKSSSSSTTTSLLPDYIRRSSNHDSEAAGLVVDLSGVGGGGGGGGGGGRNNALPPDVAALHQLGLLSSSDVSRWLAKRHRPKKFICEHCQAAFSNNGQLKGHIRIHTVIAGMTFFLFGRAFSYESGNKFIGLTNFGYSKSTPEDFSKFFYQFCFTSTSASIVSGSVAERVSFIAYLAYSSVISGFIYPTVAHWAWSPDGWLVDTPFRDFGGSGVIHLPGGACALMTCLILGPRSDLLNPVTGRRRVIRGHSTPLAALGGFILTLGFLGFNCVSQGHLSHPGDGVIIANTVVCTMLCASAGGLTGLFLFRMGLFVNRNIEEESWSLLMTINTAFIAMVASCSGCDTIRPWGAVLVGAVAAFIFLGIRRLTTKYKLIDDPLDCVAVHFGGGWWGLISAGLLSKHGLFYSGNPSMLKWNIVAGFCITIWSMAMSGLLFSVLRLFGVLRVPLDSEYRGADIVKHKEEAYPAVSYGEGPYQEDQFGTLPMRMKPSTASVLRRRKQSVETSEDNRLSRLSFPMHLINNVESIGETINRGPLSRKGSASNLCAAARVEDGEVFKFLESKLKKDRCCLTDPCTCNADYKKIDDDVKY